MDHIATKEDAAYEALTNGGTLLIYISKNKIYEGTHLAEYHKYVGLCSKLEDPAAIEIIDKLRDFIGASQEGLEKHSVLLDMMKIGVVIHHGSMPLKARLLIEDFIKSNFAKICFATSTLSQGINMPFDVVWIDNFYMMAPLNLKNLIGRSGRTTLKKGSLDYGYTIINKKNVETFKRRYKQSFSISETSQLDDDINDIPEDIKDIVDALKQDSFNDELHITEAQLKRIEESNTERSIKYILDKLLLNDTPITGKEYYEIGEGIRRRIKTSFKEIFIQHLRRKELTRAESSVLSTAIPIMLWHIQGRSFSEIVSLRYSYLSERDKRRTILASMRRNQLPIENAHREIRKLKVRFSQLPRPLPNSQIPEISIFPIGTSIADLDFDTIVYDTFDYLDKVISLSLVDPICAAFDVYYKKTGDNRARILMNYVRYGTDNDLEIWLLRYGFGFEDIEWIKEYVDSIDSKKIIFNKKIEELPENKLETISRYI